MVRLITGILPGSSWFYIFVLHKKYKNWPGQDGTETMWKLCQENPAFLFMAWAPAQRYASARLDPHQQAQLPLIAGTAPKQCFSKMFLFQWKPMKIICHVQCSIVFDQKPKVKVDLTWFNDLRRIQCYFIVALVRHQSIRSAKHLRFKVQKAASAETATKTHRGSRCHCSQAGSIEAPWRKFHPWNLGFQGFRALWNLWNR